MNNFDLGFDFDFDFNLDDFSVDFGIEDKTANCFCKPKLHKPKKAVYDHAEDLAKNITLEKDMSFYSIVSGNFIFGDLLEALIINQQVKVKNLYICTLSLSENNVDSLVNIMESGLCEDLHLATSSYFYSHERTNLIRYIYEELENKPWGFTLSISGSHMKIALIETDELKITMQGSANLRSSGNIEQFSINENEELFDFNKAYIDIIEETYSINQKSGDRGNKLWHQVQKLNEKDQLEKAKPVQPSNAEQA